ncbi:MAG: methylmalonyl Co-A mutase-associated GTPase MeaB [Saprospiraceae bacterium]|nr:methylmalonyl Co-A mutase-associated GTPase MeaB [Saprospiraceae bacterium]
MNYLRTMRRVLPTVETFVQGIRAGNRVVLGQAITLVESARPDHQALAQEVIAELLHPTNSNPVRTDVHPGEQQPTTNNPTLRIAVTGAPGVGKSTFIEALGTHLTQQGQRVAVLAIDPTSSVSKGSILGDKTRMEQLSGNDMAFIRPSPSGESLGGVARKTRETILLVEAAGYDTVIIETVGVGQSEIAAHSMTDLFLLLLLPGAGDELQGIKRGIVEMADILAVNKADGERVKLANQARAHYLNATHLFPPKPNGWTPKVLTCSAEQGTGIAEIWQTIEAFKAHILDNGFFQENRKQQAGYWFKETLQAGIQKAFFSHPKVRKQLETLEPAVLAGQMSPFAAAEAVLKSWSEKF